MTRLAAVLVTLSLIVGACAAGSPPDGAPPPTSGDPAAPTVPDATAPDATAGTTDEGGQPTPAPDGDRSWEQAYGPPDPVAVSVERSQITLTSRVTVAHGGTLTLLGAGGAFYEFKVPPNAVVSDLDITMTEVASIAGSPLGDQPIGAVAFDPEGLFFLQPATLTITPPTPIAIDEEGPFSAAGDGSDFHMYPLDRDPSVLRMHVYHFSLFGLFKTDAERRAEMIRKTAADVEAQLAQQIQQELATERQRQLLGDADADSPMPQSLLDSINYYRDRVVRPMLALAERDHTLYIEATQKFLAWERQRQLLGVGDENTDPDLLASWRRALDNYFRNMVERCYDHDLGAIIDLLKVERMNQLLGFVPEDGQSEAWEVAEKCVTFTLEVDSSTENHLNTCVIGAGKIDETARIKAEIEIRAWDEGPWTGPIRWEDATAKADCEILAADVARCQMSFAGFAEGGDFAVLEAQWELNTFGKRRRGRPEDETEAQLRVFRMVVQPGDPQVFYDGDCEGGWVLLGGGGSTTDAGSGPWLKIFRHLTQRAPCRGFVNHELGDAYYLDCWEHIGRGDEIARLRYELSERSSVGPSSETTTFLLKHTPRR